MSQSPTNKQQDAAWLFLSNPKAVPEFWSQAQAKQRCTKMCTVLLCPPLLPVRLEMLFPSSALPVPRQTAGPQGSNLMLNKAHTINIPDPNPPLTLFTNASLLGNMEPCFQMAVWATGYLWLYRDKNRTKYFYSMTLLSNQMCTCKITSRIETTRCTTAIS